MAASYFEKKFCVSKILRFPRIMICNDSNLKIVFDITIDDELLINISV